MKFLATMMVLFSIELRANCVHESFLTGFELKQLPQKSNYYVEIDDRFHRLNELDKIDETKTYLVQESHTSDEHGQEGSRSSYNKKYLEYYEYEHMQNYLSRISSTLMARQYQYQVIGKSVQGRDLYAVTPKTIDPHKKTVLMFGRHHGDEGTANWIIEGFLNQFLSQHQDYQLILYPMVNPDGAAEQKRYNSNGRDLNRVWSSSFADSKDEVQTIHRHLEPLLSSLHQIVISLDMHGSFTEDFIYRVDRNFISQQFFQAQEDFIAQLGKYDNFQNGSFQTSNGHPKMSRIMLIKNYGLNAMTHESIRDIKIGQNRTIASLKNQGQAILQTISDLY